MVSVVPALFCDNLLETSNSAGILSRKDLVVGLDVTSKKRLFEQIGLLFENNYGLERSRVFDALFARERLGSTSIGDGIAVPHGRVKGLAYPLAAVVRLSAPVSFGSEEDSVRLVVVLLAPETEVGEHFALLAELADILSHQEMRHSLLACESVEQIYEMLRCWGRPCSTLI